MIKFKIVAGSLQILVGGTSVLFCPTLYLAINSQGLYNEVPKVLLFNMSQGTNLTVFEGKLSDCVDSTDTPFTVQSFLTFASVNFGTSTTSSPLPVGASTSALQTTGNTSLSTIANNTGGLLTDTQLRATPLAVSPRPNTTGSNGTSTYKLISLASTNANLIKNSGGNLYSIIAIGLTSTVRYLKLYNKSVTPTVGTDIPYMTIPIPANTQGAGISIPFSMGVNFNLGIGIAITSGLADNDTGAISANDVVVNITYA